MKKTLIMSFRPKWRNLLGIKSKLQMKKKIHIIRLGLIILNLQLITHNSVSQNVGINADGSNGDANTMLDIKSTDNTSSSFGLKVKNSLGNDHFVVRSDGNVGIGTNSPSEHFHIFGAQSDITLQSNTSFINMTSHPLGTNTWRLLANISDGSNGGFSIQNNTDTKMIIQSTGNVGIGTTGPKNRLDVEGGTVIGSTYSGVNVAPTNGLLVEGNFGVGKTASSSAEGPSVFLSNKASIEGTTPQVIFYATNAALDEKEWIISAGGGQLAIVGSKDIAGGSGGNLFKFIRSGNKITSFQGLSSGVPWFTINTTGGGSVGIGTVTPSAKLEVCGDVKVVGQINANTSNLSAGLTCSSDKRLKRAIHSINAPIDILNQIQGKTYYWDTKKHKDRGFTDEKQYGFIAQELEKVLPELVQSGADGFKSVNYIEIIPILTEAIKEQQKIIENQKQENNSLKAQMNEKDRELELRIKQLEEYLKQANK